jgi:predicted transposase/invertase (TIGR01784 family)
MVLSRFIDPTTDFGFKRLFGQEDSKEILKSFLFGVLNLPHPIEALHYIPNEQLPSGPEERIGIYDIYCVDTSGRRFIVEMQRNRQAHFKERALYYSTFPIIHQVQKGERTPFELLPIYCISVLNFGVDDEPAYLRRVQLANVENGRVFYEGLTFVFIELSKFEQPLTHLTTLADKWVYLLKHLPALQDIPAELAQEPFVQAFDIAEQVALSPEEQMRYEASLKRSRDEAGIFLTGLQEGLVQGREEGSQERALLIARALLARGLDLATVIEATGLTPDEVAGL